MARLAERERRNLAVEDWRVCGLRRTSVQGDGCEGGMRYDARRHHRRSVRLVGYDYRQGGSYFVTVCTRYHRCLFGRVVAGAVQLNAAGRMAAQCWREIPVHFPQVALDEFTVMPNHIHGILTIVGANNDSPPPPGDHSAMRGPDSHSCVGANNDSPLPAGDHSAMRGPDSHSCVGANDHSPLPSNDHCATPLDHHSPPRGTSKTIGSIVRGFKIGVTRWMRHNTEIGDVWQRDYYEHIVRNERALHRIRRYIADNPTRWAYDREGPGGRDGTMPAGGN